MFIIEQEKLTRMEKLDITNHKLPRFPLRLIYELKTLWEDDAIQQAFELSRLNAINHIPGRVK